MESDSVSFFGGLAGSVDVNTSLAGLVVLIILLIISAIISGSEVALFSFGSKEIEELKKSPRKSSRLVSRLLSKPEHLLSSLIIGNIFINISIILLSFQIAIQLFNFSHTSFAGYFLLVLIIATMILLIGEIIPRVYASNNYRPFAIFFAPLIKILTIITLPFSYLMVRSSSKANKRLQKYRKDLSIEEISKALTDQEEYSGEKEILEGIVKFGTKTVDEVMCPRTDVVGVEVHSNFEEVLEIIRESGYSRMPVFRESMDDVRGILYIKDLLAHLDKGITFHWQPLMRQPFFVPESKKIDDLLGEFQKSQVHMAIVVDEYGGTSGIVSLEDILEEIVGDITDEFDEENQFFTKIAENEYIFEGNTLLNDFFKATGIDDTFFDKVKGEAETLAGLILEMTKEMPKAKERIKYKNVTLVIEDVDIRRINKIRVIITSSLKTV